MPKTKSSHSFCVLIHTLFPTLRRWTRSGRSPATTSDWRPPSGRGSSERSSGRQQCSRTPSPGSWVRKKYKTDFFLIFISYFVLSDPRLVAVKMLKSNHSPQEVHDLVGELMHLKEVEHPNVIRLLVSMRFTKKRGDYTVQYKILFSGRLHHSRRAPMHRDGVRKTRVTQVVPQVIQVGIFQ